MYLDNQIVYDKLNKRPICINDIWESKQTNNTTHFIKCNEDHQYVLATPKSVKEATILLKRGIIVPAPVAETHCWKCGNWRSNCAVLNTFFDGKDYVKCPARNKW